MTARMKNPAMVIPQAWQAVVGLNDAANQAGVAASTLALVHLRASQINGCSACVDSGARAALADGERPERIAAVAAWRDAPYFTDAERAALALAESVTRLSDRPDPVPDPVWDEAAAHYDETGLAGLLLKIAATNVFNRLNAPVRQPAGQWG